MPAFGQCKFARPVALVSGDREKAERVGRMYGIEPGSLYDHSSFDRIHDNNEVAAVYVVLPNARIIEAIYQSAREGKPVELTPLPGRAATRGPSPEEPA